MSTPTTNPRTPTDPPIDLRAHPRPFGSDVFERLCPAVFVHLTNEAARAKAKRREHPAPSGKICPLCETWKRFGEFHPDPLQSSGHRTYCKPCSAVLCTAHNHGEPVASVRERLAARRAAERERVG